MSNELPELAQASPRLSLWRAWLPAVVWLVLIAVESTDLLSARHTGSVLHRFLSMLFGPIDPDLKAIASAVSMLQQKRYAADYDPLFRAAATDVTLVIQEAKCLLSNFPRNDEASVLPQPLVHLVSGLLFTFLGSFELIV